VQEAGLLASLRHPNVVSYYGICLDPPCLLTEYCAHGSLAELLARANQEAEAAAMLTWPVRLALVKRTTHCVTTGIGCGAKPI
jgi:serine/threonine protein kinase